MAHLLSERALSRSTSHFTAGPTDGIPEGFVAHPKPLALHWGMPNHGFFPVDSIEVNLVDYPFQKSNTLPVTNASLESLGPVNGKGPILDESLRRLTISGPNSNKVIIKKDAEHKSAVGLKQGLQYSEVLGTPQVLEFVKAFTERVNKPAYDDWDTIATLGAGDGLNKAADALLDPEDVILVEEFTFTPFLKNIENCGGIPVPVKLELDATPDKSCGIDLVYLEDLLENWTELKPNLRKPKALYTIATGQNPTGLTQHIDFRKKVYALAEKYDFAIIEDDPYGYLSLEPWRKPDTLARLDEFLSVDDYIKQLTPSYLSIDTSGRVIRVETFSKLFSPGLRLGFVVAHKKVVNAICNYANVATRFPSGPSQVIFSNVLAHLGGVDGWLKWVLKLQHAYSHRRNVLINEIVESKAYKDKLIDFIDPRAGMFVSLLVNFPEGTNVPEKLKLLTFKFLNYGVGVVPGLNMAVDKEFSEERGNFFRLTYAPAENDEEIIEAVKRLTSAISDFFAKGLEY